MEDEDRPHTIPHDHSHTVLTVGDTHCVTDNQSCKRAPLAHASLHDSCTLHYKSPRERLTPSVTSHPFDICLHECTMTPRQCARVHEACMCDVCDASSIARVGLRE